MPVRTCPTAAMYPFGRYVRSRECSRPRTAPAQVCNQRSAGLGGWWRGLHIPVALKGTAAFSLHMPGVLTPNLSWEAAEQVG